MKKISFQFFCLVVFMLSGWSLKAQICDGNLGENIFTNGDFGRGPQNVLSTDPGIAPGYGYSLSVPPNDGLYVLTNNMGNWSNIFQTWIPVKEQGPFPDGYMMVVNASFTPGVFYEQEIDGLCGNTLYIFSADIINVVRREVTNHISPNVSFLLDDEIKYTTGAIPQDETWKTYGFAFITKPDQTTLTLTLRNNAPGGTGNDLALDNITFRACGPKALILPFEVENICEDGDPIDLNATIDGSQFVNPALQWQRSLDEGQTWEDILGENSATFTHTNLNSGFYYYRYLLASSPVNLQNSKCRINSNIKIVHVMPKFYEITDTICAGNSFILGTTSYSVPGVYVENLISSIGCDSIVTLNLSVVPDGGIFPEFDLFDPTCFGYKDGSVALNTINNAYLPVEISFLDNNTGLEVPFENLPAGRYQLEISDYFGCRFADEVVLVDPEPFVIDVGQDTTVNLGQPLRLNAASNYQIANFEWTPEVIGCGDNCLTLEWFPIESNSYRIDATSSEGCLASDSIFIEINKIRKVFIPNVFSPNGDGVNDFFTVYGNDNLIREVASMQIFDRWGNLVFEKNNFPPNIPQEGWDGNFSQNKQSPENGVLVYLISVRFLDDQLANFSGDVLLLQR